MALSLVPARAQTNVPAASPAAVPAVAQADQFFHTYAQAAKLVHEGDQARALVVMEGLVQAMTTSPWLEIALLKRSELAESSNGALAMSGYDLVLKRLAESPYFEGASPHAKLFSSALQSAAERGIRRVRLTRIRAALARYFARYLQYPESLAKLAIFNYLDITDITDAQRRPLRYIPTGMQLKPTLSYQRYDLENVPAEPFSVSSPRLEATTRVSEHPEKYEALILVPGRTERLHASENQTVDGFFLAEISNGGAVIVASDRVLVLPVP